MKETDKAVERFKEMYQIDDFQVYEFSPTKVWSYGVEVPEYKLKIALGTVNETGCKVEILQSIVGDGVHKHFAQDGDGGMHHICFAVDDYDYWKEYYVNKGVNFIFESETEDEIIGYRRCFYADDKDLGQVFEIKENPYFRK